MWITFLILAANLCVAAPGTQGGMYFKKGKTLIRVLPGKNRAEIPFMVSSASSTKWSFSFPGGYS